MHMTRKKKLTRLALTIAIAAITLTSIVVAAPSSAQRQASPAPPSSTAEGERLCEGRPGFDVQRLWAEEPDRDTDDPLFLEWLNDKKIQETADLMGERLDRESSVFGVVMDHKQRSFVVVYDPALATESLKRLESEVGEIVGSNLAVEFAAGCHEMKEIDSSMNQFATMASGRQAETGLEVEYRFDIGRLVVRMSEEEQARANGLASWARAEFDSSFIKIEQAEARLAAGSRTNDVSGHWGGANIGNGSETNCTTGFTINYGNGNNRAMLSAGHCANFIGGTVYNGSGSIFGYRLGVSNPNWGCNYPGCVDVMVIGDGSNTYENWLHVDPCCPSARRVTGWRTPRSWYNICVSGRLTKAVCGLSLTASWQSGVCATNDFGGCDGWLTDIFRATKWGTTVFQPTDSGGPVYIRKNSNEARVIGMGVLRADSNQTVGFHPPTSLMTRAKQITGVSSATVAITNGAYSSW
ncbi:MAG: hypothetical protein AAGA65_17945 [Actinomycetota bacterium]